MSNWEQKDGKLIRTYTFSNFVNAFTFMTQVVDLAFKVEHHPWWEDSFHSVTVTLNLRVEGGELPGTRATAEKIDAIYESMRK